MNKVIVKCVGCGKKKEVGAGEGQPFCDDCGMPMIAVEARTN